jgi:hypothetical protein
VTLSSSKILRFFCVSSAVRRKYFISAFQSLFLSHCLIVQILLPYKRVELKNNELLTVKAAGTYSYHTALKG